MKFVIPEKYTRYKPAFYIVGVFIFLSALFLFFATQYDINIFKWKQDVKRVIELKLSSDDLVSLNQRIPDSSWISIRLIETDKKKYRVKIRTLHQSVLDFQLNIDGAVYNLFILNNKRKRIFEMFKKAELWELPRSSPLIIQLKINGVLIGVYLMEPHIYEQLRDDDGNYLVRLNTDTKRLRKIHYEVRQGKSKTLFKYFKAQKTAAYMVFFSLFYAQSPLDFDQLVFRYNAKSKKFTPYLTMESIISTLEKYQKSFPKPKGKIKKYFKGLSRENLEYLEKKSRHIKQAPLVAMLLAEARKKMSEKKVKAKKR